MHSLSLYKLEGWQVNELCHRLKPYKTEVVIENIYLLASTENPENLHGLTISVFSNTATNNLWEDIPAEYRMIILDSLKVANEDEFFSQYLMTLHYRRNKHA